MQRINHEYYVSPEVAKLLKEAGFDWEVNHSYPDVSTLDNSCSGYMEDLPFYHNLNDGKYGGLSVSTLEVAQRWLREVKKIHIEVTFGGKWIYTPYNLTNLECLLSKDEFSETRNYNTYEEAQEKGIKKVLEIILEKGK